MPRTTRKAASQETRPFGRESVAPFGSLAASEQAKVAAAIAASKAAGASGDEMREEFGPLLSGPARRKVLRAHGFDGPAYVAPSYVEYRDGETRKGTSHAREHGPNGRASLAAAAASAEPSEMRKALRDAGRKVPRKPDSLRAEYLGMLLGVEGPVALTRTV